MEFANEIMKLLETDVHNCHQAGNYQVIQLVDDALSNFVYATCTVFHGLFEALLGALTFTRV